MKILAILSFVAFAGCLIMSVAAKNWAAVGGWFCALCWVLNWSTKEK